MDKEALKKSVTVNLRCVTQSSKGGVNLNSLQSDYKGLIGKEIPFAELGYPSLQSFLQSIPDVVRLKRSKGGLCVVEGVADSSTAHIAKLISQQKNTSAKKGNSKKPSVPIRKYHESWRSPSNNQEGISKASTSNSANAKGSLTKPKNAGVSTSKQTTNQNKVISQLGIVTKSNLSVIFSHEKSEQSSITSSNPLRPILQSQNTGFTSSPINPNDMKPVEITKVNPLGGGTANSIMSYSSILKGSTMPSSILPVKINKQQTSTTSHSLKVNSVSEKLSPNLNNYYTWSNAKIIIADANERLEKLSEVPLTKCQHNGLKKRIRKYEQVLRETEIAMKKDEEKNQSPVLLNEDQVLQAACNILAAASSDSSNAKVPLTKPKNTGVSTSTASKQTTNQNNVISLRGTKSNSSVPALISVNTGVTNLANQSNEKSKQSSISSSNPLRPILKSQNTGFTSSPINPNDMKPVKITKVNPLGEGTSGSIMSCSSLLADTSSLKGSTMPSSVFITKKNEQQHSTASHNLKASSASKKIPTNLNSFDSALSDIKITATEILDKLSDVPLKKNRRKRRRRQLNKAVNLFCDTQIAIKEQKVLTNENQVEGSCTNLVVPPSIQTEQLKKYTIMNLQTFLLSSKDGVLLNNLQRDYQNLFGIPVPYKELNYNSLEAFIQDVPDVINLKMNKDGRIYIQAVSDEETADISSEFFNQCAMEVIPPPVAPTTVLPSFHQGDPSSSNTIPPPVAPITVLPSFHQGEPSSSNFQISTVTNAAYKPSLNCFPNIKYSIASAKFSSLLTMNLLLFGDDSYMETLKRGILSFAGFDFCEGSDKWKEREILFSMLSEDTLKECLKLLCIDCKSNNKKKLVNKLLQFLASPGSAYSKRKL